MRESAGKFLPVLADGMLDMASLGSQSYRRAFAETLLQKAGGGSREEILAALKSEPDLFAFYSEAHKAGLKAQAITLAGLVLGMTTGGLTSLAETSVGRAGVATLGNVVSLTVPPAVGAIPQGQDAVFGTMMKALVEGSFLILNTGGGKGGVPGRGGTTAGAVVTPGEQLRSAATHLDALRKVDPEGRSALSQAVLADSGITGVRISPAHVLEHLDKVGEQFPALQADPALASLRAQAQKALTDGGELFLPADLALFDMISRFPDLADQMRVETLAGDIPASHLGAREGLRDDLSIQAGIPRSLDKVWGSSIDDLVQSYTMDGATVIRQPTKARTSGKAIVYAVDGHPLIREIQYHPGGGLHGEGVYYKFTYKDGTIVKVIDPNVKFSPKTITENQQYYDTQGNRLRYVYGKWQPW